MPHPDDVKIASGLLSGRLEGISFPDLLWALHRCAATGLLHLRRGELHRSIQIEAGQIAFAASNDPDDRLGEQLLRQGRVSLEQLDRAVVRLGHGKRIGALLIEGGALDEAQLVEGLLDQIRFIVLDTFRWGRGEYRFEERDRPGDETVKLGTATNELLVEGIHRVDAFSRIRRHVGSLATVYGLSDRGRVALSGMMLREPEELLVLRLEEGDDSVEGLCCEVFLSNFEIYQSLWALKVLGVIEQKETAPLTPDAALLRGRLSETSFADALVRACRSDESGVLYATRHAVERTFHIRHGRCVFATSNDPDDGLLAYLLRRGVISLKDRDETSKRLLSNKRVGTILREMGVIDDQDLQAMVRQQVKEVVYSTFQWHEGDFVFVPGELPSLEEITLEPTLEALVSGGIRRIASWSRVTDGCGSFDVPLDLKPEYLDILDSMRCGPEEWQVVTALNAGKTVREVCADSELPDFAVCQIVWSLRVLDAVSPPADATQAISPEVVAAALSRGPIPEEEHIEEALPADATQAVSPELVAAVLSRGPIPEEEHVEEALPADATQAVSPELVAAVMRGAEDPGWEPPEEIESILARFNAVQRLVYRTVRAEVGAGAANFMRACCGIEQGDPESPVRQAELLPDGSWDADGLRRVVLAERMDDPWQAYERLIERELDLLRLHLTEAKALQLRREIDDVRRSCD